MATAAYWRHHGQYEEEFDTFDEALSFLTSGEANGWCSSEEIRDSDQVVKGDELSELIWERERRWGQD